MKIFPRHTRGKGFKGIKCNPATFTTFGKSGLAYPNEQWELTRLTEMFFIVSFKLGTLFVSKWKYLSIKSWCLREW